MNRTDKTVRSGFTLIELAVVISVIVLVMAISLPTMISMFKAGADKQAMNVFSAVCTAARTGAIRDGKYYCVHGQIGSGNAAGIKDTYYLAIFSRDPLGTGDTRFHSTQGFEPQRLPGDMCLGGVSTNTVTNSTYQSAVVDDEKKFPCINVIFSPSGRVVNMVDDKSITFDTTDLVFTTDPNFPQLWNYTDATNAANASGGVAAVTLFPYGQYLARGAGTRTAYINEVGQFLPLNYYTGQMFPRR